MAGKKNEIVPYNEIQGVASTNVPAYSNEADDYISFEGCYIHGIYTGYKWQCVEYARRWLLLRKSCIFQDFASAADMWKELKYVERVTDGRKFSIKTYSNGSSNKPQCESFVIYPRGKEIPFGHITIICEVQEDFIRVAEQNYRFHYWPGNYSRQIPMVKRDGLYYINDYYDVYGWMEIENNDQLTPFNPSKSILQKYRQSRRIGKLECCLLSNNTHDQHKDNFLTNKDRSYCKVDEDFLLNLSSTSNELYRLFLQTTENVIRSDELLRGFGIPKPFWSHIRRSWINERHFDIIDHLSLKFDGKKFKLCQYKTENALTMLQSAALEEEKVQAMKLNYDFTSSFQLHHLLVTHWKRLDINTTVHILIDRDQEEMTTILYMKKVMTEAGIDSKLCVLPDDLYWKDSDIVDKDDQIVRIVWKIWNWELIFQESRWKSEHPSLHEILFNQNIRILEPIWKSIINHPIFLPVLYAMHPNHPNILDDEWILSEDSKQLPFIDWSMNNEDNFNYLSGKIGDHSDKTIVSWMIRDFFSGFTIRDDSSQVTDINNPSTYCCVF
jgi:glutathionylspermidine synthase